MTTTRVLVLAPVDVATAARLAQGQTVDGPLRVFCPNEALAATFGLAQAIQDEVEFAALQVAQVAGLARHGLRLVLTALVAPQSVLGEDPDEAENGGVSLASLPAQAVEAFFCADDATAEAALAAGVAGLDVDAAWVVPGVADLLADAPLAWHDVTELDGWAGAHEER